MTTKRQKVVIGTDALAAQDLLVTKGLQWQSRFVPLPKTKLS